MTGVTIIGAGNMGTAIAGIAARGGNAVQVLTKDPQKASAAIPAAAHGTVGEPITGDIVILALPYAAVAEVLSQYEGVLEGKVIVDITNPVDFATFDALVVPVDSSAAQVIAASLPGSSVLKAFNTTFAATLSSGTVGGQRTTVLITGDDAGAKAALAGVIEAGGATRCRRGLPSACARTRSPWFPSAEPGSRQQDLMEQRLRACRIGPADVRKSPAGFRFSGLLLACRSVGQPARQNWVPRPWSAADHQVSSSTSARASVVSLDRSRPMPAHAAVAMAQ